VQHAAASQPRSHARCADGGAPRTRAAAHWRFCSARACRPAGAAPHLGRAGAKRVCASACRSLARRDATHARPGGGQALRAAARHARRGASALHVSALIASSGCTPFLLTNPGAERLQRPRACDERRRTAAARRPQHTRPPATGVAPAGGGGRCAGVKSTQRHVYDVPRARTAAARRGGRREVAGDARRAWRATPRLRRGRRADERAPFCGRLAAAGEAVQLARTPCCRRSPSGARGDAREAAASSSRHARTHAEEDARRDRSSVEVVSCVVDATSFSRNGNDIPCRRAARQPPARHGPACPACRAPP
jgi:hypothetical protein